MRFSGVSFIVFVLYFFSVLSFAQGQPQDQPNVSSSRFTRAYRRVMPKLQKITWGMTIAAGTLFGINRALCSNALAEKLHEWRDFKRSPVARNRQYSELQTELIRTNLERAENNRSKLSELEQINLDSSFQNLFLGNSFVESNLVEARNLLERGANRGFLPEGIRGIYDKDADNALVFDLANLLYSYGRDPRSDFTPVILHILQRISYNDDDRCIIRLQQMLDLFENWGMSRKEMKNEIRKFISYFESFELWSGVYLNTYVPRVSRISLTYAQWFDLWFYKSPLDSSLSEYHFEDHFTSTASKADFFIQDLREMYSMAKGDIFNVGWEKKNVSQGLENLRQAYKQIE